MAENLKQQGKMVIGRARKGTKTFFVLKAKGVSQWECVKQSSHRFLGLQPEWGVIFVTQSRFSPVWVWGHHFCTCRAALNLHH